MLNNDDLLKSNKKCSFHFYDTLSKGLVLRGNQKVLNIKER